MKKVLIVEDQRMPRENMERILLDSGKYALSASVNGADVALAVCRREQIDLILMDVCTAGNKDGIEAATEIKAEFPDIKIIIVTSMVEVGYLKRAKEAKVDSFWYKDISPENLIDVIERTMAGESIFPDKTPSVKLGLADNSVYIYNKNKKPVLKDRVKIEHICYNFHRELNGFRTETHPTSLENKQEGEL